jgi:hypothetical protein
MVIAICGSMEFAGKMTAVGSLLEAQGHQVLYPKYTLPFARQIPSKQEKARLKRIEDLILAHYRNIMKSDAILILNYDKDNRKGWIGANSFLEMGFAHVLRKRIYLLNPIPDFDYFREEIEAMDPVVLGGNLNKIEEGSY